MSAEREKSEPVEGEVVSIDRGSKRMDFRELRRTSARNSVTEEFKWYARDGQPPVILQIRPYAIDEPDFRRIMELITDAQERQASNESQINRLNLRLGELRADLLIAEIDDSAFGQTSEIQRKIDSLESGIETLKRQRPVIEVVAREFLCKAIASFGLENKGEPLPVTVESIFMMVDDPDIGESSLVDLQRELQSFFLQVIKDRKRGKRK